MKSITMALLTATMDAEETRRDQITKNRHVLEMVEAESCEKEDKTPSDRDYSGKRLKHWQRR